MIDLERYEINTIADRSSHDSAIIQKIELKLFEYGQQVIDNEISANDTIGYAEEIFNLIKK